ncbi:MAG: PEP-CTERM sorting domain-containing protein, partial [Candidatus Schekmanbacteria bacterium]
IIFSPLANATLIWESNLGQLVLQGPNNFPFSGGFSVNYNIGFDFSFYGNTYSNLWLNSNGTITFDDQNVVVWNGSFPAEQPMGVNGPQPNESMKMIAPLWDNLSISPDAKEDGSVDPNTGIWANLIGTPGSRKLVITWNNVSHFNESGYPTVFYGSDTFQVTLTEGSTDILFSYLNLDGVTDPIHSGSYSNGSYSFPNDFNGITIGVNAGDLPGSQYIRGTQYLYGFVDNSLLPQNDSVLLTYDPDYYAPGVGEYVIANTTPVPEPSTIILLGTSLVALYLIRVRDN